MIFFYKILLNFWENGDFGAVLVRFWCGSCYMIKQTRDIIDIV